MLELPSQHWSAYRSRLKHEYTGGWLTAKHYLVLCAIAALNIAGDWEPTVAKIALEAGCDKSTVRRARARAQGRGLLAVQAQFETVDGRRWQRANHYELILPSAPCQPKPRISKGRQSARPSGKKVLSKRLTRGNAGLDLLAMARQAFHLQQMAALSARRLM